MAAESTTPLLKKLGIKAGHALVWMHTPPEYIDWLGPLPPNVIHLDPPADGLADFVHVFVRQTEALKEVLPVAKSYLKPEGMVWISWPKGSSSIPTDLKRDPIREMGLAIGLVDVKVASVSPDWSGLKFVYRLEDR